MRRKLTRIYIERDVKRALDIEKAILNKRTYSDIVFELIKEKKNKRGERKNVFPIFTK